MSDLTDLVPHIRKRPGMYLGDTDDQGPYYWAIGLLVPQSGLDQGAIVTTLHKDGSLSTTQNAEAAEQFTNYINQTEPTETSEGNWDQTRLYWVISIALSSNFNATIRRRGWERTIRAKNGIIIKDVRSRSAKPAGLKVRARIDTTIFATFSGFDRNRIYTILRNLALLSPGLAISLRDNRIAPTLRLEAAFPDGFRDLLTQSARFPSIGMCDEQIYDLESKVEGMKLAGAIRIDRSGDQSITTFVNGSVVFEGEHVKGLKDGLKHLRKETTNFGFTAYLALEIDAPLFNSPIRDNLQNEGVRKLVRDAVRRSPLSLSGS